MGTDETSDTAFGLFICYLLPGFTALYGVPFSAGGLPVWGTVPGVVAPSGPEVVVAAVQAAAAGLTVSTVRWLLLDPLHHRTGVRPPAWDFAVLGRSAEAFELLLQIHYRYYKFYANMVVALAWAYAAGGYAQGWRGAAYGALAALFFLGSRDALKKYYDRSGRLLGGGGG
ncbi:MAG: hypothetical protein K2X87_04910 [Gemmataceae bacterium]|nr:hypothetical protein [Gemmataceae bacterium]